MNWIKRNKEILFLLVLGIVFGGVYLYFNLLVMDTEVVKFNSPDETANYFWIERLAGGEELYYFEELNQIGNGLVHPRSVNTVEGKIVPGSFLGMILIYGWIAGLLGLWIIPFLTPLLSVAGVLFFYLLVKKIFNKQIGLISAVLLFFVPPWLYYSSRGLYHNILFLVLLIIGIYILINFKKNIYLYFLSGLLIGLGIITRTSEVVWILGSILFIFILNFRRIYWPGVVMFLAGMWLGGLPALYFNQILYGSFISAGYRTVVGEAGIGEAVRSGVLWQMLATPFGFNLKSIIINGYNYLYKFLPYWSIPAIIGGVLFIFKKNFVYIGYLAVLSIYLLIFYGSWNVVDRIDGQGLSLGTSYLRYWLPIYILMLPLMAGLFCWIKKFYIQVILIILLLIPTINLVVYRTDESLMMLENLGETRIKSRLVNEIVNKEDIIVVYKQADKIFFPENKKLITDLVVPADYEALAKMTKICDVYYYTFAPTGTVEFISRRDFEKYGMKIVEGREVLGSDWIYKIKNYEVL